MSGEASASAFESSESGNVCKRRFFSESLSNAIITFGCVW
jgi:hypothetical protein